MLPHILPRFPAYFAVLLMGFFAPIAVASDGVDPGPVQTSVSFAVPSTTIPSDSNKKANAKGYEVCEKRLAEQKGHPCDILFIGDSITAHWASAGRNAWQKYYGHRAALNFAVGGDGTQNVLWRLENMDVKDLHPKVAVVLIGTNNRGSSPEAIADGVKAVLTKTQQLYSGIKIILVSILPNERANDKMMEVNGLIRRFADDTHIFYLDLIPHMPPEPGKTWKGFDGEKLHPKAEGYEIWASAMEQLMVKLLEVRK